MSTSDLETLFNFDKDDLDANQNGFLSEQQRHTTEKAILRNEQIIKVIWAIIFLVIATGIIADLWTYQFITKPTLTFIAVIICFVGTLNYVSVTINRNSQNALDDSTIDAVQGQLSKFKKRKPRSLTHNYFIFVGDMSFSVSNKQYKHLINDDIYTIYFTPRAKTLVSLEKLSLK